MGFLATLSEAAVERDGIWWNKIGEITFHREVRLFSEQSSLKLGVESPLI